MMILVWLFLLLAGGLNLSVFDVPLPEPPSDISFEQQVISVGELRLEIPYPSIGTELLDGSLELDCDIPTTTINMAGTNGLVFTQVPADCDLGPQQALNGNWGLFRTLDDVPEPFDVHTVETPIGSATLASYTYTECTNSCTDGTTTVAIIELDNPVDPNLPTLQVQQRTMLSPGEEPEIDLDSYVTGISPA